MNDNSFFINVCEKYIVNNGLYKYNHNSKYSLTAILNVIEYVLITGASWRSLNLAIFNQNYKWQSIYYHYNKFSEANVFQNIYINLLNKYCKHALSSKLKYISTDTSFIKNEYATDVNFNGYCKKKKLSKISLITDANGVTLSIACKPGNMSDQQLFFYNIDSCMVNLSYESNNNKHKRYLLADSIYDTSKIKSKIKSFKIEPIIAPNKRNTKDKAKILRKQFSPFQKQIFKKRMIVENAFSWIYKSRRTNRRYDKKVKNYLSFIYMALIKIIFKRI